MKIPKISLIGESMAGKTSFIYSLLKEDQYLTLRDAIKDNTKGQTKLQVNYVLNNNNYEKGIIEIISIKFDDELMSKDSNRNDDFEKIKEELCKKIGVEINVFNINNEKDRKNQSEIKINKLVNIKTFVDLINNNKFVNIIKNITVGVMPRKNIKNILEENGFDGMTISDCRGFMDENNDTRDKYNSIVNKISGNDKDICISKNNKDFADYLFEERGLIDTDYIILLTDRGGIKMTKDFQECYKPIFESFCNNYLNMILARESRLTEAFENNKICTYDDYIKLHNEESDLYNDCGFKYATSFNETIKTINSITNENLNVDSKKFTIPELLDKEYEKTNEYYKKTQEYILKYIIKIIKEKFDNVITASDLLNDEDIKVKFYYIIEKYLSKVKNSEEYNIEYFGFSEELLRRIINNKFNAGINGLVGERYGLTTWIPSYGRVGKGAFAINRFCYNCIFELIGILASDGSSNLIKISDAFKVALKENSYYYSTFASRFMYSWDLEKIIERIKSIEHNNMNCKEIVIYILRQYIILLAEYIIEAQNINSK